MPVFHEDQRGRKPRRARGLAWLLVLPGLLLVALVVPVFTPVQVRINGAEWTASSTWEQSSVAPQGISTSQSSLTGNSPPGMLIVIWMLRLGDWRYTVYRSDFLGPGSSGPWSDRKWGIRFQPRAEPAGGD